MQKNTKSELKRRLLKAVDGLSKEEALEFLDKYKDNMKRKNAFKSRQPKHIKGTIEKVMKKLK